MLHVIITWVNNKGEMVGKHELVNLRIFDLPHWLNQTRPFAGVRAVVDIAFPQPEKIG